MSRKHWRCFHCDELFTREVDAAEHFGISQSQEPACRIKSHEGHLVHYIRKLETELASYRADDSDIMRAMMVLESDHRQALIRSEEDGYGKGVRDMKLFCEATP